MPLSLGIASGAGFLKNKSEPAALGYRVNYIKNPSFEVDIAGWTPVASATLARTTSEFYTGVASLSVTNTSGSAAQFGNSGTGNMIPLIAGEGTYYVSAYIKLANGNSTANYFIRQLQYENEAGLSTVSAGNVGTQTLSYTGNWVRLSAPITKASNANFMIIRVVTASTVANEVFYVDSVMLEKSNSLGSYFDGGSNGFWAGSENASFSGGTPY
jgi:hypothetical protein